MGNTMSAAVSLRMRSAMVSVWPRNVARWRLIQPSNSLAFRVSKVSAIGNRQRHHEMATAVADYTLNIAFVVALGGPSEFIFKTGSGFAALQIPWSAPVCHRPVSWPRQSWCCRIESNAARHPKRRKQRHVHLERILYPKSGRL